MKYKVGDRVKVKSRDWYKSNMNSICEVDCGVTWFVPDMVVHCGNDVTIGEVYGNYYRIIEDEGDYCWTDEMFEGLADARETPVEHPCDWLKRGLNLPDGFEFQDENGNVINTKKITLVKKEPKYPTTYEECREILNIIPQHTIEYSGLIANYKVRLLIAFQKLLICRDAYWKIAGDWKPEFRFGNKKYCIMTKDNKVITATVEETNRILAFPTAEMRDTFYENFKDLINDCKELL